MSKSVISRVIAGTISLGFAILINYFALPAWSLTSGGFWGYLFCVFGITAILFCIAEFAIDEDSFIGSAIAGSIVGVILVAIVVISLIGCKMFHSGHYQQMLTIKDGVFAEDVTAVSDVNNITVVDMATAEKLGDRTIGGIKNSTWFEVDNEYNIIMYQNDQYRISPLNYGGLFKYNKASKDGIPGYVLVNAVTQEAMFVQLDECIKISPTAYFGNKLKRVLRRQYGSYVFSTSYFEIDEKGHPYWITGVTKPTIGVWKARVIDSVILTDACTGKSEEYELDEVPAWVDHIYPLDYLMEFVEYNYKYINGFWNFSKTGVNKTTYSYSDNEFTGYNTIVNSNDEVVFYTGVTPYNNAESNLGFILASPRTGKVKYYNCTGAEESSAQAAAEGLVQNLGYKSTFPTVINVNGVETYFMALKDAAGLIQRYSLCQISNYTNVVEAPSLSEALEKYLDKIGMNVKVSEKQEKLEMSGKITYLSQAQIDGYTYYYFNLNDDVTHLYMSSIINSNKQVVMKVGDNITIEYINSSEKDVYMVKKITIG